MIRYHAAWILPISEPPIRHGWLAVDRGRVVALGAAGKRVLADGADVVELGDVALLPGLVNAHTHLELSYLRDEVPPASQFVTWIRGVMKARRERPAPSGAEILEAAGALRVTKAPVKESTFSVHLLGTCRMGNDPATSVVDKHHRCHDVPNLFLCDGSSLVTSGRGQPTMTIQALAFRAAEAIAGYAKRGEIAKRV